jgi:hypothetical protein
MDPHAAESARGDARVCLSLGGNGALVMLSSWRPAKKLSSSLAAGTQVVSIRPGG